MPRAPGHARSRRRAWRWERDAAGAKQHPRPDRPFTTHALHVPLEDWFTWILDAGFALRAFREPVPTAEAIRAHPGIADAARIDLLKAC